LFIASAFADAVGWCRRSNDPFKTLNTGRNDE
jgi:hypothetical protein